MNPLVKVINTNRSQMCNSVIPFCSQGIKLLPQAGLERTSCLQKPRRTYKGQESSAPILTQSWKNGLQFTWLRSYFMPNNFYPISANTPEGESTLVAAHLVQELLHRDFSNCEAVKRRARVQNGLKKQ